MRKNYSPSPSCPTRKHRIRERRCVDLLGRKLLVQDGQETLHQLAEKKPPTRGNWKQCTKNVATCPQAFAISPTRSLQVFVAAEVEPTNSVILQQARQSLVQERIAHTRGRSNMIGCLRHTWACDQHLEPEMATDETWIYTSSHTFICMYMHFHASTCIYMHLHIFTCIDMHEKTEWRTHP